jgi:cyclic pyranopterin monophosphate synthase
MLRQTILQFAKKNASTIGSTHIDKRSGLPMMVNIQAKLPTERLAVAEARVVVPRSIASLFLKQHRTRSLTVATEAREHITAKKGPVLATAIVAGTLGAKLTSQLIPFCHPIPLEQCKFQILVTSAHRRAPSSQKRAELIIRCLAATTNKTGVEMEAMVGASVCALAVYDMLKGVDGAQKSGNLFIGSTRLLLKSGGKSGDVKRKGLCLGDDVLRVLLKK